METRPNFITATPPPTWLYRGYTGHEHLPEFGLINMNGRVYDPVAGRMLSPDPYIMLGGTQGYNRYTYVLNNPLKYTDPSGDVIIEWIGGFFSRGGSLGDRLAGGDARVRNSFKLIGGLFAYDGTYRGRGDFWRDVWQVVSRHTWEGLQTGIGFSYAYFTNLFGATRSVDYYHGATVSTTNRGGASVSLGSYIKLGGEDEETQLGIGEGSYTTMHEYGHYLQSRRFGFVYMSKIGLQSSLGDATWTEHDANFSAARYFQGIDPNFTWVEDYYENNPNSIYTNFRRPGFANNERVRAQWWEYLIHFSLPGGAIFSSLHAP